MKHFISTYKLTIVYLALFSINALFTSVLASLQGLEWRDMTPTARTCVFMAIGANWTGVILAFLNQSISRTIHGQPFLPTGDTTVTTKTP